MNSIYYHHFYLVKFNNMAELTICDKAFVGNSNNT